MRLLIVSDSHGDTFSLRAAVESQKEASAIIYLGDGSADIDSIIDSVGNRKLICVRGNCDYDVTLPYEAEEIIGGKRIICLHGHTKNVKYGTEMIASYAKEKDAYIALYGHTHTPASFYIDDILFFNPGSIKDGSYGWIDIENNAVVTNHISLF